MICDRFIKISEDGYNDIFKMDYVSEIELEGDTEIEMGMIEDVGKFTWISLSFATQDILSQEKRAEECRLPL